jgi:hypothetical protein
MERLEKTWWKRKRVIIPLIIFGVILLLQVSLPPIILKQFNERGKDATEVHSVQAERAGLNILRGVVRLHGLNGTLKEDGTNFLFVDTVTTNLSWLDLFRGIVRFDVAVKHFDFIVTQRFLDSIDALPEAPDEPRREIPNWIEFGRLDIVRSRISLPEFPGLEGQEHLAVNDIQGSARNILSNRRHPLGSYDIEATFTGESTMKGSGNFSLMTEPPSWTLDGKMLGFRFEKANPALLDLIPVSFRQGSLDVYSEVKSTAGTIRGYVKPFINEARILGTNDNFQNARHFIVEVVGEFSRWIFESRQEDSVATRVPFVKEGEGEFQVETGEAISKVVRHRFTEDKVEPGLEGEYRLTREEVMQAQEDPAKAEAKAEADVEDIQE